MGRELLQHIFHSGPEVLCQLFILSLRQATGAEGKLRNPKICVVFAQAFMIYILLATSHFSMTCVFYSL